MAEFIKSIWGKWKSLIVFEISKANIKLEGTYNSLEVYFLYVGCRHTNQTSTICSESENVIHINRGLYTMNLIDRQIVITACKIKAEEDLYSRQNKLLCK